MVIYFIQVLEQDTSSVPLEINQERKLQDGHLPYKFSIQGKQEFTLPNYEYNYPVTGIQIKLKRNKLGRLTGGFYVPTAIFSVLSMISFLLIQIWYVEYN